MSKAPSEQRRRVADAAVVAEKLECVPAVDVIPADQDPTNRWVLDLLVTEREAGPGVPATVHELLGESELGSVRSGLQDPDYYQVGSSLTE